jgi:hypothetical protein
MTLSFLSSHYIQSARFGSLSPYVKPYITLVLNKGYKPTTIVGQLRLIARLNRWLLRMDYDLGRLDERVLEHFQKCEQKKRRTPADGVRVTLQRFLGVLRDARVAPPAEGSSVSQTAVQCLTERYRRHLLDDQGLAESTVVNYTWHVQKFLSEQFGAGAVNLISLQAQDAITFIRHTCAQSQYPACATPRGRPAFVFSVSALPRGDRDGFGSGVAQCGKLGIVWPPEVYLRRSGSTRVGRMRSANSRWETQLCRATASGQARNARL